jgi:hypothetical protein
MRIPRLTKKERASLARLQEYLWIRSQSNPPKRRQE